MLKVFQIILHILAMRDKKLSDPSSQVCSLGSKVTGLVSYLEEDNGFFWLQRNPERVEEIGESLERQVVECVVEHLSLYYYCPKQFTNLVYETKQIYESTTFHFLIHLAKLTRQYRREH